MRDSPHPRKSAACITFTLGASCLSNSACRTSRGNAEAAARWAMRNLGRFCGSGRLLFDCSSNTSDLLITSVSRGCSWLARWAFLVGQATVCLMRICDYKFAVYDFFARQQAAVRRRHATTLRSMTAEKIISCCCEAVFHHPARY